MTILLKKYIRNLLNEISKSKMTDDNPMWKEYQKLLLSPLKNSSGPRFYNSVNRARELKDFYRKNADQNWLNGPIENIIAIHSPIAFRFNSYSSYNECKRDMLKYYPCNAVVKNELSALGAINPDPSKFNSRSVISKLFKSKSSKKSSLKNPFRPYYWLYFSYKIHSGKLKGEISGVSINYYLNEDKTKNKVMTINKGLIPIEDFTAGDTVDLNTIFSIDPKLKTWNFEEGDNPFQLVRSSYVGPDHKSWEPEDDGGIDGDDTSPFFYIYLHLTPRRITHASMRDVMSNTYGNYPSLKDKNLTIEEYNNLSPNEFFELFGNEISHDDYMQFENCLKNAEDMPLDDFEEIKRRNRHLRQNISSIDYTETRTSSGFKRYPHIYLHPSLETDNYTVLDKEDLPLAAAKGEGNLHEINGINYLGEIIVGHWAINELYVIKGKVDIKHFKKWMSGKLSENRIHDTDLQIYYRIRYFMECGIPVNIV
jgi:hypothetical protein